MSSALAQAAAPAGYGPSDILAAYALPGIDAGFGAGRTVAVVDAYDLPTAESDLGTYRSQFGLPPCTAANSCFRKVDQNGGTNYPIANTGWDGEIALDIEMVSAVCPNCKILLVEANSASLPDLGTAVNTAALLGAVAISNSYLGPESSIERTYDAAYYDHPGIAVTASSGDTGYGVGYPAVSPYVVAVGGTSLRRTASPRGWTETAWSGSGSGCSKYESKPTWQTDSGCARRTVADVSAVADPNTGVAVYSVSQSGWVILGGTSVASPIIASVYALAGKPVAGTDPGSYPYAGLAYLNDVSSGSDGSCGGSYLCTAGAGYDGPTGLGTPDSTGAFAAPVANNFSISASPASMSVAPDSPGTSLINTTLVSGAAESISLSASGLPSGVAATFVPASVSAGGSSTLTITADGSAASGTYSLTLLGTAASASHTTPAGLTVTAAAAPTISSVTPAGGPPAGGTTVTITGTGLKGATAVFFGGAAAASSMVSSDTQINAVSPAGSGTVDVTVTTPAGTSATSAADQFLYQSLGFLRVTTSPALPSQISLNGIVADSWGLNWLELPPGSYTVHFSHVEGYTEPADQVAVVTAGATTAVVGSFVQRGSLSVITNPPLAGQISVDGVPTNDWGMWTDVPAGSHVVCFGAVAGYTAPACQIVTVTAGALTAVTGTYTVDQ